MQLSESGLADIRPYVAADHRMQGAERSRTSTTVFLWVGMTAVYILSALAWLHFLGHGYFERR